VSALFFLILEQHPLLSHSPVDNKAEQAELRQFISDVSVEVAQGTDASYRRYAHSFMYTFGYTF
jgi:hypothetical protein